MADDLIIRIDVQSAAAMAATNEYGKAIQKVDANLARAAKAQAQYDAAVAASGKSSEQATAAQVRLGAALARTTEAEQKAAIAAAKSAEVQAAASAKAAAAADKAAAAQTAAAAKVTASRKAQASSLIQSATGFSAASTGALALGAAFIYAAKSAADFDQKLATIHALNPAADISALSAASKKYADLGISASGAADAEIELVKAGVSVNDILGGGLAGTLTLAAAGELSVADAASIAAQAMTEFGLHGQDLTHIADLLSAGANKALGSVQDLGVGLSYAGGPAHTLGVSIEDTVATLAEFAQAGLIGAKGGAALQTMFARLVKPTAAAQAILDKYNITLYDSKGQFVGMSALAGEFHDNMQGLSLETRNAALQTIFGNRAFRAAAILYNDGADGAARWRRNVDDAGNAANTAQGKLNSLNGDLKKLGANLKNLATNQGEGTQSPLRTLTQDLTDLVGLTNSPGVGHALSILGKTIAPAFAFSGADRDLLWGGGPDTSKQIPLWTALGDVQKRTIAGLIAGQNLAANSSRSMGGAMLDTADSVGTYKDALDAARAAGEALTKHQANAQAVQFSDSDAGRIQGLSDAIDGLNKHSLSTADSVSALSSALDRLLSPQLNLVQATDAWNAGLRHLNDGLAKSNRGLFGQGDAVEKNRAAINGLVGNYEDMLTAGAGVNESADQFNARMNTQYYALIKAGVAAGFSRDNMVKYLATLGLTPSVVSTKIDLNADGAINQLDILLSKYDRLDDKTVTVTANIRTSGGVTPGGHTIYSYADGGPIRGVGTGTSDSNLIRASRGEHMLPKREVDNAGGHAAIFAMRRGLQSPVRGYAAGGPVGRSFSGGSTTHTYTADMGPLIAEVAALREEIHGGIRTTEQHPERIASQSRLIALNEVQAQSRWASRQ